MSLENYKRPSLTTDIVLFRVHSCDSEDSRRNTLKELQIKLVKRNEEPEKGCWGLPGGFVDIDEDIFANVLRKLEVKTGISGNFYIEQLYTWGDVDRDSRGRVISVSFLGLCNEETYVEEETDRETGWFNVKLVLEGNLGKLSFDHQKIIEYALERLVNKIEYTDIAFNLLPSEFTISECQAVYSLILNKKILNFRRKIAEYVTPLNKQRKEEGKQFRPAELYSVRKNRNSKF